MSERITIKEVFKLTCHAYKVDNYEFKLTSLKVFVDPMILLHFLAFDGIAVLKDNENLFCDNWNIIPDDLLSEIKAVLSISFFNVITGKIKPCKKGYYTLKNIKAEAYVDENGIFTLPDHKQLMKYAQNELLYSFP